MTEILKQLFLCVAEMGITATYVILAVYLVRVLLKRAPKVFSYILWSVVGFRLLFPVSLASWLSMFNFSVFSRGQSQVTGKGMTYSSQSLGQRIQPSPAEGVTQAVPSINYQDPGQGESYLRQLAGHLGMALWIAVLLAILAYACITYVSLKKKTARAVLLKENIYECENISTPFVLGIIRPNIYLPFRLTGEQQELILLHEQHHIRRRDHLVKLFALLLLAVYWFHPLVWAAYFSMVKDMEMSCDEWVIRQVGNQGKKGYSMALLGFASSKKFMMMQPLAFGESATKSRIKNILNFKRPGVWGMAGIALVCVAILAVCGTNAKTARSYIHFSGVQQAVTDSPPGDSTAFDYSLQKEIHSYGVYTEVYDKGELYERKLQQYGAVGKDGIERKGQGKADVWADRNPDGSYSTLHVNWNLQGGDAPRELSVDLPKSSGTKVDLTVLEDRKKPLGKVAVGPDKDIVLAALSVSQGSDQAYSCLSMTEGKQKADKREITVLYRIVFSKMEEKELKENLLVSTEARRLFREKQPYAGDASANGKLLGTLCDMGYMPQTPFTTELETSQRPYVLRIVFSQPLKDAVLETGFMRTSSHFLLALIDNLDEVQWRYEIQGQQGEITSSWDAEGLTPSGEKGPKAYGVSAKGIQELMERASVWQQEAIDSTQEETVIGGASGPVSVFVGEDIDFTDLDQAIDSFIEDKYRNESHAEPDIIETSSHIILKKEEKQGETKAYLWTMFGRYREKEGTIDIEYTEGAVVPAEITVDKKENGTYQLTEYWIPRDGNLMEQDISSRFPEDIRQDAMDSQKYAEQLMDECIRKALERARMYQELREES